jgi:hypothetical protein
MRTLSVGNLSNVYRACSFFTISDLFCIDNARAIGQKIRYLVSGPYPWCNTAYRTQILKTWIHLHSQVEMLGDNFSYSRMVVLSEILGDGQSTKAM